MSNIAIDIVGVLGFCLSLFLVVREYAKQRENYRIEIVDYSTPLSTCLFLVCIENLASVPLVITEIVYDGARCELVPRRISTTASHDNPTFTPQFPLSVPAGGASYCYIEFLHETRSPLDPGKAVTFQIRTTRKLERKTVVLGSTSHYLHANYHV